MSKPRVYVETTIPSAYYTDRSDPAMAERREHTRRWWAVAAASCELVTSVVVQQELLDGRSHHVPARLALLDGAELLLVTAAIRATARTYVQHRLMPANPPADALHLALASHLQCDVLVTWNYRHLANAHKLDRIRRLNVQLGLHVPRITSPSVLLGERHEQGREE